MSPPIWKDFEPTRCMYAEYVWVWVCMSMSMSMYAEIYAECRSFPSLCHELLTWCRQLIDPFIPECVSLEGTNWEPSIPWPLRDSRDRWNPGPVWQGGSKVGVAQFALYWKLRCGPIPIGSREGDLPSRLCLSCLVKIKIEGWPSVELRPVTLES